MTDEALKSVIQKIGRGIVDFGPPPAFFPRSRAFERYCSRVAALYKGYRRRLRQARNRTHKTGH